MKPKSKRVLGAERELPSRVCTQSSDLGEDAKTRVSAEAPCQLPSRRLDIEEGEPLAELLTREDRAAIGALVEELTRMMLESRTGGMEEMPAAEERRGSFPWELLRRGNLRRWGKA
jgi:hypothetical protein